MDSIITKDALEEIGLRSFIKDVAALATTCSSIYNKLTRHQEHRHQEVYQLALRVYKYWNERYSETRGIQHSEPTSLKDAFVILKNMLHIYINVSMSVERKQIMISNEINNEVLVGLMIYNRMSFTAAVAVVVDYLGKFTIEPTDSCLCSYWYGIETWHDLIYAIDLGLDVIHGKCNCEVGGTFLGLCLDSVIYDGCTSQYDIIKYLVDSGATVDYSSIAYEYKIYVSSNTTVTAEVNHRIKKLCEIYQFTESRVYENLMLSETEFGAEIMKHQRLTHF